MNPATPSRDAVHGFAHAKLNLFLEVLGKRADGFHELESVFHEIELGDELEIRLRSSAEDRLRLTGVAIEAAPEQNLAMRAVRAVRAVVPELPGVDVRLVKHVPPGGGLGGGSADAAFVLRALASLVPGDWTEQLPTLAADLGSDVPFFLVGGTAVCRGRGEIIEPVAMPAEPLWFAMLRPPFALSTAAVFGALRSTDSKRDVTLFVEELVDWPGEGALPCFNRLETPAFALAPQLADLRQQCADLTATPWFLTGSGSVLFSVHRSEAEARCAVTALGRLPEVGVFLSSSVLEPPME